MGRLDKLDLSLKLLRDEEAKRIEAAPQPLLALRLLCGGLPVPRAPGEGRLGPPVLEDAVEHGLEVSPVLEAAI